MLQRFGVPVFALALWVISVGVAERGPGTGPLPAFHEMPSASTKKQAFFEYLTPVVRAENERIREQRRRLLDIAEAYQAGEAPGLLDQWFLEDLADTYRLPEDAEELTLEARLERLLARVDVVPRGLVLVQAAKESGWGTSYFAREANNLFGQWCFERGCGLVPRSRAPGRSHEVRSFDTVRESVASYLRNLNTHRSYRDLRAMRAEFREEDLPLSGVELAEGLERYSERGQAYVREVQAMIRQNGLDAGMAGG